MIQKVKINIIILLNERGTNMAIKEFSLKSGALIKLHSDRFDIISKERTYFSFPVNSLVSVIGKNDCDLKISEPSVTEKENCTEIIWNAESTLWEAKSYILSIHPDGIYYRVKVKGEGKIEDIDYFNNNGSGASFNLEGFAIPEAFMTDFYGMSRKMNTDGNISYGYFQVPSFVYPFYTEDLKSFVGVGVAAKEGEYKFNKFQYKYISDKNLCYFKLPLDGRTEVKGEWESQGIWCDIGEGYKDVIYKYSSFLYGNNFVKLGNKEKPRWWQGPIYCGWGDQCEESLRQYNDSEKAQDFSAQAFYEKLSDRLDELELKPTMIIIDDKWQKNHGSLEVDEEKWPDLRKFADEQHAKGRRVILWVRAWHNEGIDLDECMTIERIAYAADPTNPKYQERIYKTVHKLLSSDEGCYNCDGFKLDFINNVFMHPAVRFYDNSLYGVEVFKKLITLYHDAAKKVKPDALINNSIVNPYFSEVTDHIRLNDYNRRLLSDEYRVMKYRADIASASQPHTLIDTDSASYIVKKEAMDYLLKAHTLGIPDIYMLNPSVNFTFDKDDYKAMKEVWDNYAEKTDKEYSES